MNQTRNHLALLIVCLLISCKTNNNSSSALNQQQQYFMELWNIFDEHYAFFELRGVDWEKEKATFLQNYSTSSDSLLFQEFCRILRKFDDTHINLENENSNWYCNAGAMPAFLNEFPSQEAFGLFLEARNNTLKEVAIDQIIDTKTNIFQYGKSTTNDWGYLRIKRFYGASLDDIKTDLQKVHKDLAFAKKLIIDIRANPGGNDPAALLNAGYFFKEKEIAFIKTIRNGKKHTDFSAPDTTYLTPSSENIKNQSDQIYLLTNRAAGSSADVFALVMSYLPNVTIIGENTEGIFSDMHRDTLSNGWRLTLSNERYFSKDGKCYEKIGVPVDLPVSNRMEEVRIGIDEVLKKAIGNK